VRFNRRMSALHHPLLESPLPTVPHGRTAHRLSWRHLPQRVRTEVEARAGAEVVDAHSQDSGFTPGLASRLVLADGQRVFVKAASRSAQRAVATAYAEEARVLGLLPGQLPAPRLLWAEPDLHGWTVVAFVDVDGRPPRRPWREPEVRACLDALTAVAVATDEVHDDLGLRPLLDDLPTVTAGWDLLAAAGQRWPHHDELTELAHHVATVVATERHFVHLDGRDDNFLLLTDGTALLCDWNWPALGPAWIDVVHLLVSVHGDGLDADVLLRGHPLTSEVADDDVDAFLAGLAGLMAESDLRPVPPTSPHLGTHRRWWAAAAHSWLSARRGWH
jgi:hypothetical protein